MTQTKIRNSLFGRSGNAWPKAVQAVTPFVSTDDRNFSLIVYLLDYAITQVLQITSISKELFTVTDVIVNAEFHPTLSVANLTPWVIVLRFPKPMSPGTSFSAVLRAPAAPTIPVGSCYPKPPVSLVITTDHGDFAFTAGNVIRTIL